MNFFSSIRYSRYFDHAATVSYLPCITEFHCCAVSTYTLYSEGASTRLRSRFGDWLLAILHKISSGFCKSARQMQRQDSHLSIYVVVVYKCCRGEIMCK